MSAPLDKQEIAMAMIDHGGGFVKALGNALLHADFVNEQRIYKAFPEYTEQYSEHAEKARAAREAKK